MLHFITTVRLETILCFSILLLTLTGCGGAEEPTPTTAVVAPTPTLTATPVPTNTSTPTPLPPPTVSDPVVSVNPPVVIPGEEIGISVIVDGAPGAEITYQWTDPEGKGQILIGQGTDGITFKVPTEPGTYKIEVLITASGIPINRHTFITVEEPTSTPTPTPTEPPATDTPTPPDTSPTPTEPSATDTPPSSPPQPECPFDKIPIRNSIQGPSVDVEVDITSLENCTDGLPTASPIPLSGTISRDLTDTEELWILVYASDTNYYPQSANVCDDMPTQPENGQWKETIYLGRPGVPEPFYIVAVITDVGSPASEAFHEYLRNGCNEIWGFVPFAPPGTTELDSIIVHTR